MTKKKEQKTQKETPKKSNEEQQDSSTIEDLESQLEEAQKSAKDNWDKLLRSQAEMENLKRRTAKDLENARKYALDGFVKALLEVSDSLTMGIKSAREDKATLETTTEGLELTMKVFNSTLKSLVLSPLTQLMKNLIQTCMKLSPWSRCQIKNQILFLKSYKRGLLSMEGL